MSSPPVRPPAFTVSPARLRRDLEHVAGYGATASGGVGRTSFSPADRQVRTWLAAEAGAAGLGLRTDGIGNMIVRLDAPAAPPGTAPVWAGSHLDSVPEGGRFDGALGSLAALEVVRRLAEERVELRRPVEAVIFADEEGNYHHLLGSTAMVRNFAPDELAEIRGRDGDRLVDALRAMDWDLDAASRTAVPPGAIHAYVELHIEQGASLESEGATVGVVTEIVGMGGGHVVFRGRQDHAGTTPMSMRRDALRGAGDLLVRLPEVARSISEHAVITCGILHAEPGGANVVPGLVRMQLDFRDRTRERMLALEKAAVVAAHAAAERHDLDVEYTRESITDPVPLDPRMQELVATVAADRGLRTLHLPSGAGHDAQNMAQLAPAGMIFIPSVGGRSHTPAELSTWEDIEAGANVLLGVVHTLATE